MKTTMYVITHKETSIPKLEGYELLYVGASQHPEWAYDILRDDSGDNISRKNKNYCELTGYYWVWKNSTSDIVGICHYRRFFTKALISKSETLYLTTAECEQILNGNDIIVPRKMNYIKSVKEMINFAPNEEDMKRVEMALKLIAPDYLEYYYKFLRGKSAYLYNMCIMRKSLFDAYCEWLFPILQHIEDNVDLSGECEYRQRLFGFLSERLIMVWIKKNIPEERVKQYRVVKTDESIWRITKATLLNFCRGIFGGDI